MRSKELTKLLCCALPVVLLGSDYVWAVEPKPQLDTLLYTPAQRQAIVRARQGVSETSE